MIKSCDVSTELRSSSSLNVEIEILHKYRTSLTNSLMNVFFINEVLMYSQTQFVLKSLIIGF